jgi:hypothetical protein
MNNVRRRLIMVLLLSVMCITASIEATLLGLFQPMI